MKLLIIPLLSILLAGCVTTPGGQRELSEGGRAALREVAAIALERQIRDHGLSPERVERVRAVLVDMQQYEDITTVDALAAVVQHRIDNLSDPLDRQDFTRLVRVARPLLNEYVGAGRLDADGVVRVRDFLGDLAAALPPTQPRARAAQ